MNSKKKKKKSHLPVRLNILFFVVFLLFSVLILRLGIVQIVYGDDFRREIERTEDVTVNQPVPRGKMFDRTGKVVVDNIPQNAITYTNTGAKQDEMIEVAKDLAMLIEKDTDKVTERDKKDFWIIKNPERANEKVTEEEKDKLKEKYEGKEYDRQVYKLRLDRITEEELSELSDFDMEVLAIYREFTSGYALTPQTVKNKDVTPEEFAVVSENLQLLPGVDTTTDWERYYAFDKTLRSVLGNITSSEEGIPAEQLDYYLARDYSRNDRVGKSYIEMQYEDVLQGQKARVKNVTDKAGNVLEAIPISEGKRGNDLVLSIDMDLQLAVEKIIEEELTEAKKISGTSLLDRAFVTVMDPHTGEILTMAGKQFSKDENGKRVVLDAALGNITTTYNVGSAIKGATVLTGYKTGAIKPNEVMFDTPVKIAQTIKSSWKNLGYVNDIDALKMSSNIYMFHIAMNIGAGKGKYQYGRPLKINPEGFDILRDSFAQFGLGVRTGIDLPNEQIGFKGMDERPGFLLDLSIGQYDTYSNMQLAQYVSTIANGGNRMEPHIVKEIREPLMENDELGPIVQEISPKVLNRADFEEEWFKRVQKGFKKVAQEPGGTAYTWLNGKSYNPAGKTGTAEAFYDGPERSKFGKEPPEVINLSFVGYAPADNPEIAISVLVPWAYNSGKGHYKNIEIAERVFDTYFELKKQRQMNTDVQSSNQGNGESENETQENEDSAE